jgi:hypothetical protein
MKRILFLILLMAIILNMAAKANNYSTVLGEDGKLYIVKGHQTLSQVISNK